MVALGRLAILAGLSSVMPGAAKQPGVIQQEGKLSARGCWGQAASPAALLLPALLPSTLRYSLSLPIRPHTTTQTFLADTHPTTPTTNTRTPPIPSLQSTPTPNKALSEEDIDALTKRTQDGGTEVVQAKAGKGSATLSMVG